MRKHPIGLDPLWVLRHNLYVMGHRQAARDRPLQPAGKLYVLLSRLRSMGHWQRDYRSKAWLA